MLAVREGSGESTSQSQVPEAEEAKGRRPVHKRAGEGAEVTWGDARGRQNWARQRAADAEGQRGGARGAGPGVTAAGVGRRGHGPNPYMCRDSRRHSASPPFRRWTCDVTVALGSTGAASAVPTTRHFLCTGHLIYPVLDLTHPTTPISFNLDYCCNEPQ